MDLREMKGKWKILVWNYTIYFLHLILQGVPKVTGVVACIEKNIFYYGNPNKTERC
jgi:hypothetical protein